MFPSTEMGHELKFQQRWEFRRKDNDFDSSSDEAQSCSSVEKNKLFSSINSLENDETSDTPRFEQNVKDGAGTRGRSKTKKPRKRKIATRKKGNLVNNDMKNDDSKLCSSGEKHKLVSTLNSPEKEETVDIQRSEQNSKDDSGIRGCHKNEKAKKRKIGSRKKGDMKMDSSKKAKRRKSRNDGYEPNSFKDIQIFMESLLEELKVTRENLLTWMKQEMHKLLENDMTLKPTRRESSNIHDTIQLQHHGNFETDMKLVKGDTTQQLTKGDGRYGQDIIQVQHQNDGSGMKSVAGDTYRKPARREGSSEPKIIPVQLQNIYETGVKLMAGDTTQKPSNREGSRGQQIVQPHQNNFESGIKLTANETAWWPIRREGSCRQEFIQLQHQNNFESTMKVQKCNGSPSERSVKSQRTADSNNRYQVFEGQVEHGQDIGPLSSTEKEKGERVGLPDKPKFSSGSSDHAASSMYLTLPSVLPAPHVDSSLCNYSQTGITRNRTGGNSEIAKLLLEANSQHGYFSDMRQEEIGRFPAVGSRNMGRLEQNKSLVSGIGDGFPVSLHQGLDSSFSIPNHTSMENIPRENNMLGLRMNGGAIRFSGGIHALSERYVANGFHSHLNYKS